LQEGQYEITVPTVGDRIAQTVVARRLEAKVEPIFHADSYGYRPGRSPRDAVAACRKRCWKTDWVIDLDIQKFFDSVPWDLVVKAVAANTDDRWVVLYVQRWLQAPVQLPNGALHKRDRGTPQGSLCAAAHNPPYEQRWVMRSVGLLDLVRAGPGDRALRITHLSGPAPLDVTGSEEPFQAAPAAPIPDQRRVLVTQTPQLCVQTRHQRGQSRHHSRPHDHAGPAPCRTP